MKTFISLILMLFFLGLLSASLAAHSDHGDKNKFTKHFTETLFVISDRGEMSIELLLNEKEYKIGRDVIGIVIHDTHDEDVEGATIEASLVLPEGDRQLQPVTDKGGGLYLLPSKDLPAKGAWKLKISVKKKKMEDSAVFIFPDMAKTPLPADKYDRKGLMGK